MGEAVVQEPSPTLDVVGTAFAPQYYHVLHQSPEHVHRFYQDISKMGRPDGDGAMTLTTTIEAIKEKILSLDYSEFKAEIKTVDAQESFGGGVLVHVTGYLTGKDDGTRNFTQVFFLAPQENGYFVLNDSFRYVEDVKSHQGARVPVNEIENPPTAATQPTPWKEAPVLENTSVVEEVTLDKSHASVVRSQSPNVVPEEPVVKGAREIVQSSPESVKPASKVQKKSYASMVKVPAAAPLASSAPAADRDVSVTVSKQMKKVVAAPAPTADIQALSKDSVENGHQPEEGHSVYIKALPLNATPTQIEAEFKQFGPIKPGGVQVRSSKGFCYGFVEFKEASAAWKAVKASPIMISGHEVTIQEKKSTNSRVNNKQRFPAGRGNGFKNEDSRGHGNNGGNRGRYGRGSFNNSDHNGKGNNERGFFNRGTRNGYQRYDNNNDRHSHQHPPGTTTNKPLAPRNPAAA